MVARNNRLKSGFNPLFSLSNNHIKGSSVYKCIFTYKAAWLMDRVLCMDRSEACMTPWRGHGALAGNVLLLKSHVHKTVGLRRCA